MLQAIRDRLNGIIAIFVFGLLAVPFVFWGVDSYTRAVPLDAVASVGEGEISSQDFQSSFANYRARLRQQLGDRYNDVETGSPESRRAYLEGMIDELLMRQHSEDMGLVVGDRVIAQIIHDTPAFQIEGRFNPDVYLQALASANQTPREFERGLREDIQTRLLPVAVASSAVITEPEVDRLIALQSQTRKISLLELAASDFADEIEISEADIEAFYQEHLERFTTEERVRLAYVVLDGEDLLDDSDVNLSEEELMQRYDAARQRFLTPEARQAAHILITAASAGSPEEAEALAGELDQRLRDGASFAELAAEYSDDPVSAAQGGDLGWIEPGDMVEPFEEALYAMEQPGERSGPVETRFGWHLIELGEIRAPQGKSFEEAREEILAEYLEGQREDLYIELSHRMEDLIYADDSSLAPMAAELELEIQQTDWFTRQGGSEGIIANARVVDAAFSDMVLLDGAVADPIEVDRNRMVAIHVAGHEPAEPRPLAEVSEEIRERLLRDRSRELAQTRAQGLIDELGDDAAGLDALAEQREQELVQFDQFRRNDMSQGWEFSREVFRLAAPQGQSGSLHVVPTANGYAVVRLEEVRPGNPAEADPGTRQFMRRQLQVLRSDESIEGLLAQMRTSTKISVDESRL